MTRWLSSTRLFFTQPSLVRRGVGSVLLAFFVVWAVLSGYVYYNVKNTIANDSGFQKFGNALTLSMADIQEPEQAIALVASTAAWTNKRRKEIGMLPGVVQFELLTQDGQRIYASTPLINTVLVGAPGKLLEQQLLGQTHRIYQGDTPRWRLSMAEPKRSDADILRFNSNALLPYLSMALPIVLFAVWLSVSHGLKPLQQLARRISQRKDNDLSPIGFKAQHQELEPLVQSLDTMLAQLRHKVAHERAFVQDAAHELRTPMAVITAQAHVMAHTDSPSERVAAQQHLEHAITRASHLAQQLLDLAALDDAGRPAPRSLDVAQWLRQVMAQAAPGAIKRQIEMSLEAPNSLVTTLDVPALESIVHNLLDNAVRYGQAGGTVVVTLGKDHGKLNVTVQDDGPGIAQPEQARVFERFYRGSGHEVNGSGLGLAIVQQAALRLGGSVQIVRGLGSRGVGFCVQIPLA
jgi:two-component system, OmpR family, sensor histidine kinase QseC